MAKIGIFGCGVIGSIFARGLAAEHTVYLTSRRHEAAAALAEEVGATAVDPKTLLASCDVLILAVKPQQLEAVAATTENCWRSEQLVVSVLAGVEEAALTAVTQPARTIRLMVNIAMAVNEGIFGLIKSEYHEASDRTVLTDILQPMGRCYEVEPTEANAFCVLAGCTPGYTMTLVEAWIEGAILMGMKPDRAREIIFQMLAGSAALGLSSDASTSQLRWSVCSPGGSTIAGIKELEDLGVRSALINGLLASYQRTKGLGDK